MTEVQRPPPLRDVRVLELGRLPAGPFCGQLLGDFGAEVIRPEDPRPGDPMRRRGREKPYGKWLWWPVVARNKQSASPGPVRSPGPALGRRSEEIHRGLPGLGDEDIERLRSAGVI